MNPLDFSLNCFANSCHVSESRSHCSCLAAEEGTRESRGTTAAGCSSHAVVIRVIAQKKLFFNSFLLPFFLPKNVPNLTN